MLAMVALLLSSSFPLLVATGDVLVPSFYLRDLCREAFSETRAYLVPAMTNAGKFFTVFISDATF